MSGDLRTGRGAGRLRRILGMRLLRVASAGVLSLAAMLLWRGLEPSAPLTNVVTASAAVASALSHDAGADVAVEQRLPSRQAAQPARVGGRPQLLARTRATDELALSALIRAVRIHILVGPGPVEVREILFFDPV